MFVQSKVYDAGGNNNGQLDPGETVDFTVFLKNVGGQNFTTLNSTLSSTDPYITITDNTGYFGSILIDSTRENAADKYRLTVSSSAPMNHLVPFRVIATQGSFCDTFDFSLRTAKLVPMDTGYYYTYYNGGIYQQCPVYSWYAIDTTQTAHPGTSLGIESDDQTVTISLPFTFKYYGLNYTQVSVCSNGWIALGASSYASYSNTALPSTSAPPTGVFGFWDDLNPGLAGPGDIYSYHDAANHRFVIEFFKVDHFSPTGYPETFEFFLYQPGYPVTPTGDGEVVVQYNTVSYLTSSTMGIQNTAQNVGIQYLFDNVYDPLAAPIINSRALKYTTTPPSVIGIAENSAPTGKSLGLTVSPNPSCGQVRFMLSHLTQKGRLTIFDAAGRLINSFVLGAAPCVIQWSGTDAGGRTVPAGIYFVRVEAGLDQIMEKIVLTR